jgi:hypothetical protein
MNIIDSVYKGMMDVLKDSLLASGVDRRISFYDNSGELLGDVVFTDIEDRSIGDGVIMYTFVYYGNTVLSFTPQKFGTVSSFKIMGVDPDDSAVKNVVIGTVGPLSSSADIRMNRVNWVPGNIITFNKFSFVKRR